MAYSQQQTLRRARAKNEGASKRLVRVLQQTIAVLKKTRREEFTQHEITTLQGARLLITGRLELNAMAKAIATLPADTPENTPMPMLDPRDL
jgi:hypothetical protein